jgi:Membrane bound beta barrel domain (DUF5777)
MKRYCLSLSLLLSILQIVHGQDSAQSKNPAPPSSQQDINDLLKTPEKKEYVTAAFKAPRVVTSQSIEMVKSGVLNFVIQHRFGNLNSGPYEFFGLDQATIRLGLDYGLTNDFTIGIGRGSYKKEADAYAKYRIIQQSTGPGSLPFSLIALAGITYQGVHPTDPTHQLTTADRTSYYGQLIIGRKFSNAFSLQMAPTLVHRNLVPTNADPNDTYALEIGVRYKLTRRISLNGDYYILLNKDQSRVTYNPLSIGFDIETGGHVFQLHFTNAIGMNERAFITETTNSWGKGAIQFGFNISRAFQVKRNRE